MTSQPGLEINVIHIMPSILRSKGNQTMRFAQLIDYNRNIFLQKSETETSPRPLSER